jgi:hypothetical protein
MCLEAGTCKEAAASLGGGAPNQQGEGGAQVGT